MIAPISLTNELWVHRIMSHSISGRETSFKIGVRIRDGKCVISGMENEAAEDNDWSYFEAAHVFPLEKEDYWNEKGYANFITDMDNTVGDSKINSVQNGLLLRRDIHTAFDNYLVGINPDVSIYNPSWVFFTDVLFYRMVSRSLFLVVILPGWMEGLLMRYAVLKMIHTVLLPNYYAGIFVNVYWPICVVRANRCSTLTTLQAQTQ